MRAFSSLGLLLISVHIASAQVFWTVGGASADRVERGNTDGTGQTVLWNSSNPAGTNPWGIAFDHGAGQVYWTDSISRQIHKINADGTGLTTLFTHPVAPFALAFDPALSRLYFVAGSAIVQSDLAGNASTFVNITPTNTWLALDLVNRYLYWTESSAGFIRRANIDGTPTIENIVNLSYTASPQARGLALPGDGRLYWVDAFTDFLYRINLADYTGTPLGVGPSNQLLNLRSVTNGTAATPNGLASDGERLYWAEGLAGFRGIYRVDLSGAHAGILFPGDAATSPLGVAAAPVPEPAVWLLGIGGLAAWYRGRVRCRWRRRRRR
jgi:sugar lactone lactonase YvrE